MAGYGLRVVGFQGDIDRGVFCFLLGQGGRPQIVHSDTNLTFCGLLIRVHGL